VVGSVALVGAGPGDPRLITLRGLECLEQAEVIVHDRLVAPELLDRANPVAERVYVGKAPGRHALSQDEINAMLVERARRGQRVVRLKGGDPFVFGRGGEEGLALSAAGIPFEVVPGVTSAIAAAASAGIPVTHRGVASSFTVVTGHEDAGKPDTSIRWSEMCAGADTLVVMMGIERLAEIAHQIIQGGRRRSEPAAVIRWGTTAEEEVVTGSLGDIAERVDRVGIRPPAVLVVGDVVALRADLDWRSRLPLAGLRVLVTRARAQASQLTTRLRDFGAGVLEYPTIEIRPLADTSKLDAALGRLGSFAWVVLTSVNGVEAVVSRLNALGRDARAFAGSRVCAIGPATAGALGRSGIRADWVPTQFMSDAIVREFPEQDLRGAELLLARADIAPPNLAERLRGLGARVTDVAAYLTVSSGESRAHLEHALEAGDVDLITLTSSSTARNLVDALGTRRDLLNGISVASIGPVTSRTARELGLRIDVEAAQHTIEGLVAAIIGRRSSDRVEVVA
jgi:uroporphyrinogen III methyltransferase/synthase